MGKQQIKKRSEIVNIGDQVYRFESEEIGSYCPEPDPYDGYTNGEIDVDLDENDKYCKSVERVLKEYDGTYVYRAHMYPQQTPEHPSVWTNGGVIAFHCHVTYRARCSFGDECVTIDQIKHNSPTVCFYTSHASQRAIPEVRPDAVQRPTRPTDELCWDESRKQRCAAFLSTIELDPPQCKDEYIGHVDDRQCSKNLRMLGTPVACVYCSARLRFSNRFFAADPTKMYGFHNCSHPCLACRTSARKKRKLAEYQEKIEYLQDCMIRLRDHDDFGCAESDSDTDTKYIVPDMIV